MTRRLLPVAAVLAIVFAAPAHAVWEGWTLFKCGYDAVTGYDLSPCEYKGTYASSAACTAAGVAWCARLPVNAKTREICASPSGTVTVVCTRN